MSPRISHGLHHRRGPHGEERLSGLRHAHLESRKVFAGRATNAMDAMIGVARNAATIATVLISASIIIFASDVMTAIVVILAKAGARANNVAPVTLATMAADAIREKGVMAQATISGNADLCGDQSFASTSAVCASRSDARMAGPLTVRVTGSMARVISNGSTVRTADGQVPFVATANGGWVRRAFSTHEQVADLRLIVVKSTKGKDRRRAMAVKDSRGEKNSGVRPWDLAENSGVLSGANPGDGDRGMEAREAKPREDP